MGMVNLMNTIGQIRKILQWNQEKIAAELNVTVATYNKTLGR